jgi:cyclopropane-fatty-acyl-phospholipid synthase
MTATKDGRLDGLAEPEARRATPAFLNIFGPLQSRLSGGRLNVVLPSGRAVVLGGGDGGVQATLAIERWRALRRLAVGGDIGFAEAYLGGELTTPDLVAVLRLAVRNRDVLSGVVRASPLLRWLERLRHVMRRNTRSGSRRNIVAHYDLGNDFYRLWLDAKMQYSSGLWADDTPDLDSAQTRKLARVVELLELSGRESVLEIGCGWGALAAQLQRETASKVVALTLSPAQLDWAHALETAVDFRLQDYRDIRERFDRIVSIEMLEAVGKAWLPRYFNMLANALNPGGRAVLQAITIDEALDDDYQKNPDFIQKYIFPGGFLPTKSALAKLIERAGLRVLQRESFGLSYARTLAEWRRRFQAHWGDIAALGFDDRFRRLWDYYLCYCEAGFAEGTIDVSHYVIGPA